MTRPEIRQVVEQTRTAGDGDPAIRALLEATDEAGNPDWLQRAKGVELALAELASLAGESGRPRCPGGRRRPRPFVPPAAVAAVRKRS